MADEEAFFVVVGIDEPASDTVGTVAADLARLWIENIDAFDLDLNLVVRRVDHVDIRFAEDDK